MQPRKPGTLDRAERAALRLLRDLIREQQRSTAAAKPIGHKPAPKGHK